MNGAWLTRGFSCQQNSLGLLHCGWEQAQFKQTNHDHYTRRQFKKTKKEAHCQDQSRYIGVSLTLMYTVVHPCSDLKP